MRRRRLYFTIILGVASLGSFAFARAQEPAPPEPGQAPADSAEKLPPPPPAPANTEQGQAAPQSTDAPAADAQNQGEPEVYNRGPIHEAFAIPGSQDPVKPAVVNVQPPEPIDEQPPDERPDGENVIWIPGYWAFDYENNNFFWVSGVWRDVPPGRTWVPGYWTSVEGGFIWVPGNWTDAETEEIAYLPEPPASEEAGPTTAAPGEGYFWVPGSWVYQNNDYVWNAGYWAPHQRDWIWVPARYTYSPFGYIYTPGYWDYLIAYRGVAFAPVYFRSPAVVVYTPSVVIDTQFLALHLFVGPRFGWYYYGDFYGPTYANLGFVPFYDFHHRIGYDPLYAYYRWRFGRDFDNRLVGWHNFFRDHEDFRPRHTFREQRDFAEKHRGDEIAATTMLTSRLNDIVRSDRLPLQFSKLTRQQRDQFVDRARRFREFTSDRVNDSRNRADKRDRGGFKVRGDDRLAAPAEKGQAPRRRMNVPDFPNRMNKIQPDDQAGKSARVPSPRSSDTKRFTPERTLPRFPKSMPPGPRSAEKGRPGVERPGAAAPRRSTPEPKKAAPAPSQPKKAAPAPSQPKRATPAPSQPRKAAPAPSLPKKAAPAPSQPKKAAPAPNRPAGGNIPKSGGAGKGSPPPDTQGGAGGPNRSGNRDGGGRPRRS